MKLYHLAVTLVALVFLVGVYIFISDQAKRAKQEMQSQRDTVSETLTSDSGHKYLLKNGKAYHMADCQACAAQATQ